MAPRSRDTIIAALDQVAPLIQRDAAGADRDGRYSREVIDALFDARLFRLWIPRSLDGDELSLPDSLVVFEAVSRLDGSAGWLVTIGTGGALFAATMDRDAAEEIYRPSTALIAGSGTPSGHAIPVAGGYRVSGEWRYASGSRHASWFTANCTVGNGSPGLSGEPPQVRAMAFPAASVEILDTWHVTGMRATDSHDIRVQDEFVPEHRSFDVFGKPREGGPLYRVPFGAVAQLSFAAVALGIARHAIDAFRATTTPARRDRSVVRSRLGEADTTLRSARTSFYEQAHRIWSLTEANESLPDPEIATVRLAAAHATASAVDAVEQLYLVAGMAPLYLHSEFGRCWRDVHTVSQHSALSPEAYAAAGEAMLDGDTL